MWKINEHEVDTAKVIQNHPDGDPDDISGEILKRLNRKFQRINFQIKMIKKYLVNYFDKIKDTKKVAREKNVGVWWLPVFDSFLITIYLSWPVVCGSLDCIGCMAKWSDIHSMVHGFTVGGVIIFINNIHEHNHIYNP